MGGANGASVHLPPLPKGGERGFEAGSGSEIPPNPPLKKGGIESIPNGHLMAACNGQKP